MRINIRKPLCFSEIGRKDNQEDFLWPARESATRDNRVFLMCDGVGGQDSGEVASETAANALGTFLAKCKPEDVIVTKAMFEEALAYGYDELDKVDTGAARKIVGERSPACRRNNRRGSRKLPPEERHNPCHAATSGAQVQG